MSLLMNQIMPSIKNRSLILPPVPPIRFCESDPINNNKDSQDNVSTHTNVYICMSLLTFISLTYSVRFIIGPNGPNMFSYHSSGPNGTHMHITRLFGPTRPCVFIFHSNRFVGP